MVWSFSCYVRVFCIRKFRNTNIEARNKLKIKMFQTSKQHISPEVFLIFPFGHLNLFRISDFAIRICFRLVRVRISKYMEILLMCQWIWRMKLEIKWNREHLSAGLHAQFQTSALNNGGKGWEMRVSFCRQHAVHIFPVDFCFSGCACHAMRFAYIFQGN